MLAALQQWFGDHIYQAILVAATLEGLGLPVPTEVIFLPGAHLARQGEASLVLQVLLASLGNLFGSLIGFGVAYRGGQAFFQTVTRWLGVKPEARRSVESFFTRYGQATVFLSRFIGFIRAATIYSAGLARMSPIRFGLYLFSAGLIWYGGWAYLILRFEHTAQRLLHRHGPGGLGFWLVLLVVAVALIRIGVGLYRKRKTI